MKTSFTMALMMLAGVTIGAVTVQAPHARSTPPAYVIAEIDVMDQDGYARHLAYYSPCA
jgi:hypothetical protein